MKRKPVKIGRALPVRRAEQIHKSPTDYNRRENQRVVDKELSEMDEEEDMKDYTQANKLAEEICDSIVANGINAARVTDTEPPVIEVYGITDEVLKITVDVE